MSRVVHDMAVETTPISLQAVAELPATGATGYLAALLIESGAVPTQNFDRIRLEVWEQDFFATIPDSGTRILLHRYAAWIINPRFADPPHSSVADDNSRLSASKTHLKAVAQFLEILQTQGWNLGTMPQRLFDDYVAAHGRTGKDLTPFIRWARSQHLTQLRSEYPQSGPGGSVVSENQRWDWVADLLSTDELKLAWCVGGLLVLLYGATLTRLVSLRHEAVDWEENTTRITLGTDPIELPVPVGALVRQLLDAGPMPSGNESPWLFPGARPGRHLTTAALSTPLAKRGIDLRGGRRTALIILARDVPPSVLADLLGVSIDAATRWSALGGRDWIDYPASGCWAPDSLSSQRIRESVPSRSLLTSGGALARPLEGGSGAEGPCAGQGFKSGVATARQPIPRVCWPR
ncbi:hypothetical protein D9R06_08530 [Kocuria marina subsp. indica]|nr:hypothetical protein B1B07_07610 [Kocuria indica]RLP57702.1 hypothetical protein D9R06_08530 [Kocuria indica]